MYNIIVMYDGYSNVINKDEISANCSCTLIKGEKNIIVDTMTSWDSEKIINGLQKYDLSPSEIQYVVSTHGHSDHIGNNNLFTKATHIVGFSVSFKDKYFLHPFDKDVEYIIDENVKILPTPGHTLSDVTVIVKESNGVVGITGDLFECYEDISDPSIWIEAGSEDSVKQRKNRLKIAEQVDWIVPGHGPMFQVNTIIRDTLRKQVQDISKDQP